MKKTTPALLFFYVFELKDLGRKFTLLAGKLLFLLLSHYSALKAQKSQPFTAIVPVLAIFGIDTSTRAISINVLV